jgi:hypothetical protein
MVSGLFRLPPFWKKTVVTGSHKWKLDFTFTKSTMMKTDSTWYLEPSRNRTSLPMYPTAYGIHQHTISISLQRLNSPHALVIPKSVNFTDCWPNSNLTTRSLPNCCERCIAWHHMAFLRTYYTPFGWDECPLVFDVSSPPAKELSWPNLRKLLTRSLITACKLRSWPQTTHVVSHVLPLNSPMLTSPRKDLLTWRNNSASLLLPSRVYKPRWKR